MSEFDYKIYSNSPATHWIMGVFNSHASGRELTLSKEIKLGERVSERMNQVKYSYESKDCIGELIVQEFNKKLPATSQLAMIFILIKGNHQNWRNNKAVFQIEDFINFKGEEVNKVTREVARRQLKETMKRLLDCKIEIKYNSRSKKCALINLLASYNYDNGFCTVEFPSSVVESLNIYPQLFPSWGGKLTNQKSFAVTIYVYYRIKQAKKHNGVVKINVGDLLAYAGIPYAKEQVNNRRYKQLIVQPFLKAVEEIHLLCGKTLEINIPDYGNIDEFLNSYVIVNYDQAVANYYTDKSKSKTRKARSEVNEPKSSKPSQRVSQRAVS